MSVPTNGLRTSLARPPVRGLLIVARDRVHLYEFLQHAYGDSETIAVLVDRRQADRRQAVRPVLDERRRRERRSPPALTDDLRFEPYVLVRPHSRRPQD